MIMEFFDVEWGDCMLLIVVGLNFIEGRLRFNCGLVII